MRAELRVCVTVCTLRKSGREKERGERGEEKERARGEGEGKERNTPCFCVGQYCTQVHFNGRVAPTGASPF